MKILRVTTKRYARHIFMILFLFFAISCNDPSENSTNVIDYSLVEPAKPWQDLINELDLGSGILVQTDNSIQDALDAAQPGDAIYVEPGIYHENITIEKSDITLIGITGSEETYVELKNANGVFNTINKQGDGQDAEVFNILYNNKPANNSNSTIESSARIGRQRRHFKMSKEQLTNNIAHYKFEVGLGDGEFDVVRIHRLVQESKPYRPNKTDGAIFMVHGASQNFEDIFLYVGATDINENTSSPFFLASNGIDVWGIDLAWTLVPAGTTDFSFMEGWDISRDVNHVLSSMSIARLIRGLSGQGFGRMNLLGFSYSVSVLYAAAGLETQQHRILQDIKGIIPIESLMKYGDEDKDKFGRENACFAAAKIKALIESGVFQNESTIGIFGQLAIASPDEISPLFPSPPFPPMTNFQAALFVGTNTFVLAPQPNPFWHFVGGEFENGLPIGLVFSDASRWIRLLSEPHAGPFMPEQVRYEFRACLCDKEDVTIDDHLSEIKVPTLYIGAGGGFGEQGEFTTSLLSSTDVTSLIVSKNANPALDFGHADPFMADNADVDVWEVMRQWLVGH